MLFKPPPTAGSSGGPIIDEGSGAVVGVMLGTRMDNRVEGLRGWGVPSESIFEVRSFVLQFTVSVAPVSSRMCSLMLTDVQSAWVEVEAVKS